ncbi:MAG TPA: alpha-L-arabinofuranosidase C-terminal domain-containing protein [Bryobacteraceae bacterium]|nr:alpha-L-arabinofuranosidase C-terminal domain-containing protein [Bryobacteraceae bacterium]
MSRRGLALSAGVALFAAVTPRRGASAPSEERRLNIRLADRIATIKPELHGQFAEHLGSCIYGGIWVGKDSPIPNVEGYRKQAIEYLKAAEIPVLRWPGGCFADDYHWRDGIGPVSRRPKTVNIHWGNYTEDNSFGTHEFMRLCQLIGAQPYLAGNVGSGTPQELRDWAEYCNYPSGSTLSEERTRNGSPEPFNVKYWGVGNENWACGGNMTPESYALEYRRFSTYLRTLTGKGAFLIACGPNRNDLEWTRRFMEALDRRGSLHGYAMHFYSSSKTEATKFTPETLRLQLAGFADLEKAILEQRALLDKYDPERRIGLLIDEWGVWDRMVPAEEKKHGRLWQQIPMRAAVAAAMGLNVFHRQADKLAMCNIAQTVNVLHAILLTDGDECIRTSTYWAFDLLKAHRGKEAVRVETGGNDPLDLSVSASVEGKQLVLTCVNPRHDMGMKVDASLAGGSALGGKARFLHDADMNACNTFDNPDRIVPRELPLMADRSRIRMELPPLSVATAIVRLA